jgi:hypothetical protein
LTNPVRHKFALVFVFSRGILRDENGLAKTVFVSQNPTCAGAGSAHCVF